MIKTLLSRAGVFLDPSKREKMTGRLVELLQNNKCFGDRHAQYSPDILNREAPSSEKEKNV